MLARQLERRFGAVPNWARERMASADIASLEDWGLRLLDAASIEEVFGE